MWRFLYVGAMRIPSRLVWCVLALASSAGVSIAEISLPTIFSDGAVLQRGTSVAIWGAATPGASIELVGSWGEDVTSVTAKADGSWRAQVPTGEAGGPFELVVRGDGEVTLRDVYLGEVWLCSGQSNMEWPLRATDGGAAEMAIADFTRIRHFNVPHTIALEPADDVDARWVACSPDTIDEYSAVAYYFAKELLGELDVPVGLVASNWGGTVAEAWTSPEGLVDFPEFTRTIGRITEAAANGNSPQVDQHTPSVLFHGMIAPLIPYTLRGALWYQGESNVPRAAQYRRLFPALIRDWRKLWNAEFPFYYVQIAPFNYKDDKGQAAELREAQTMALAVPKTGMAVTMDIGNPNNIHPRNKLDVARRLARFALANEYEVEDVDPHGPMFQAMEVEDGRARLSFEHADGLTLGRAAASVFTIAGADRKFYRAKARLDGETVIVWSGDVPEPVAVRFAWRAGDEADLQNAAGLPAPSFRTDDWPAVSAER